MAQKACKSGPFGPLLKGICSNIWRYIMTRIFDPMLWFVHNLPPLQVNDTETDTKTTEMDDRQSKTSACNEVRWWKCWNDFRIDNFLLHAVCENTLFDSISLWVDIREAWKSGMDHWATYEYTEHLQGKYDTYNRLYDVNICRIKTGHPFLVEVSARITLGPCQGVGVGVGMEGVHLLAWPQGQKVT